MSGSCSSGGFVEDFCRAPDFGDANDYEGGVGRRICAAITIVDVDVGFAEAGGRARKFAGTVRQCYLGDFGLRVGQTLGTQYVAAVPSSSAFLLNAHVAQQRLVAPEKSVLELTLSTESK